MTDPRFPEVTVLGMNRQDRVWTYVLFCGGGALLFLFAPLLAEWLRSVPIVPFKEALEWVGSLDQPWAWFARPAAGAVLGAVFAMVVIADEHLLEVRSDSVVIVHDKDRRRVARDQIEAIHLDGKKVIIEGAGGRTVFDQSVEAKRDEVRAAFSERGYPFETE